MKYFLFIHILLYFISNQLQACKEYTLHKPNTKCNLIIQDTIKTDKPAADSAPAQSEEYIITNKQEPNDFEFVIVDRMPSFRGGDIYKFWNWAHKKVVYPDDAIKKGLHGKVMVSFVVNEDGRTENVQLIKSLDPILDKEAVNVIKKSPKWKPGQQDGKPVKVKYTISIIFILQ